MYCTRSKALKITNYLWSFVGQHRCVYEAHRSKRRETRGSYTRKETPPLALPLAFVASNIPTVGHSGHDAQLNRVHQGFLLPRRPINPLLETTATPCVSFAMCPSRDAAVSRIPSCEEVANSSSSLPAEIASAHPPSLLKSSPPVHSHGVTE